MIYYQVVTRFYDNGESDVSQVKTLEGDKMPTNSYGESAICDVYYDYFESEETAEKFRREALNS